MYLCACTAHAEHESKGLQIGVPAISWSVCLLFKSAENTYATQTYNHLIFTNSINYYIYIYIYIYIFIYFCFLYIKQGWQFTVYLAIFLKVMTLKDGTITLNCFLLQIQGLLLTKLTKYKILVGWCHYDNLYMLHIKLCIIFRGSYDYNISLGDTFFLTF